MFGLIMPKYEFMIGLAGTLSNTLVHQIRLKTLNNWKNLLEIIFFNQNPENNLKEGPILSVPFEYSEVHQARRSK